MCSYSWLTWYSGAVTRSLLSGKFRSGFLRTFGRFKCSTYTPSLYSMIKKLFIIDDEPIHHKLVGLVIKYSGHPIEHTSYTQAADAFAYLVDDEHVDSLPDLILLDLNMAIISGWDFLELFETFNSRFPKPVDVIILTSSINPHDKARALTYNCVKGFFSKPFTEGILDYIVHSSELTANKNDNPL